jgi:hypothetical protein
MFLPCCQFDHHPSSNTAVSNPKEDSSQLHLVKKDFACFEEKFIGFACRSFFQKCFCFICKRQSLVNLKEHY